MDPALQELLLERLASDPPTAPGADELVLAALLGDDQLDVALDEGEAPPKPSPGGLAGRTQAPGVYIESVTVEGFRGIGPLAELRLQPGPGLTLVVGRNGSGKSSFAEAIEVLFTGDNARWSGKKSKVWRDSWRNLHHTDRRGISVELVVDGQPSTSQLTRTWNSDAALETAQTTGMAADWSDALVTYRPFLSHNELGSALEAGPTSVFEALATILGLGDVSDAAEALRSRRLERKKKLDLAKAELVPLLERLSGNDDERALLCRNAVSAKNWDLDAVEAQVIGAADDADPETPLRLLRALSTVPVPDPADVAAKAAELREALAARQAMQDSDAAHSRRIANLLTAALAHHEHSGDGPCPVCRAGNLDGKWQAQAEAERAELNQRADAFDRLSQCVSSAESACRRLQTPAPGELERAEAVDIDAKVAIAAWSDWLAPSSVDALPDHVERTFGPLRDALIAVRTSAEAELSRREDSWRPVAQAVRQWIVGARSAQHGAGQITTIRAAEDWLHSALVALRNERFAPIQDQVLANWELLRQGSSVSLDGVRLEGKATLRHVELDVTIDQVKGAALGVMSQGELYSLALCLFLPRAMARESPFGFIVIDDPVQAMDPAKVDGLAQVLDKAASLRQVVVFTHDDRLPEAVRRMQIPARVIEVTRRATSIVHLRESKNPIERLLDDARAVAKEELPSAVAARVVPGLLREAMEAAAVDCVRRRRLKRGQPHAEVEDLLVATTKLYPRVSLALFDDPARSGEVLSHVHNKYGKTKADALAWCNKGAHDGGSGDLLRRVDDVARLARALAALA